MVGLGLGDAVGVDAGFHHRRLVPDRAGIDVRHRSRASLRFPQWWGLRSGLNSRAWWRFNALMTAILASIVGPSRSATSGSACVAVSRKIRIKRPFCVMIW